MQVIDALLPLDVPQHNDAALLVGLCRGARVADRAVARSVAAVEESLLELVEGGALEGLEVRVAASSAWDNAWQGVSAVVAGQEAVWASWVALAGPTAVGKAAPRRRAVRARDSESDSDSEAVPASEPRRQPRRSTRATRAVVEGEGSDEENVAQGKEAVDVSPLRKALASTQL